MKQIKGAKALHIGIVKIISAQILLKDVILNEGN
jgi:hypothetical protein